MAATDARRTPEQGAVQRVYGTFTLITTGKESSGALTALAAFVSKDGGAYASCTNAPVQQGTTGMVYVELTVAEMGASFVQVKFTSTLANTTDVILGFSPAIWAGQNGRGLSTFEELIRKAVDVAINKHAISGTAYTVYQDDSVTASVAGTLTEGDTTATRSKLA